MTIASLPREPPALLPQFDPPILVCAPSAQTKHVLCQPVLITVSICRLPRLLGSRICVENVDDVARGICIVLEMPDAVPESSKGSICASMRPVSTLRCPMTYPLPWLITTTSEIAQLARIDECVSVTAHGSASRRSALSLVVISAVAWKHEKSPQIE